MIRYLLIRKPVFPVICDLSGHLIGAGSEVQLEQLVMNWNGKADEICTLIDSTGEDWYFSPEYMALSPLSGRSKWTKKEIIELFNNSDTARKAGVSYSTRSLSAKRLDRIIGEIADMIYFANQQISK